jgi:hypothetical protein
MVGDPSLRGHTNATRQPSRALQAPVALTTAAEREAEVRMSGRWRKLGVVPGTALFVVLGAAGHATELYFVLSITGAEGGRYSGYCVLTTALGEEKLDVSGIVPRHEELVGEALVCRIKCEGLIAVQITHDGNISRSVTNGGIVNVA